MKKYYLIIIILFSHFLCAAQLDSIKANEETKEIMILAIKNADKYLNKFFGDSIFNTSLKWNIYSSRVDAKYNYTYTNYLDSIFFVPQEYNLNYKIYDDNIYVDYLYINADSLGFVKELPTNHNLFDDLVGYKLLLNKTFLISKLKAIEIGEKHGIKGDSVYAKLENNRNEVLRIDYKGEKIISYYWLVSVKDCKKCDLIHIDPLTGKLITKLKVIETKTY
jgi:hypothetical protein